MPLVSGSKIVQTVSHEPGPADCRQRLNSTISIQLYRSGRLHLLFFDLFALCATAIQKSLRSRYHSNRVGQPHHGRLNCDAIACAYIYVQSWEDQNAASLFGECAVACGVCDRLWSVR